MNCLALVGIKRCGKKLKNASRFAQTAIEYITGWNRRERKLSEIPEYFTIAAKVIERAERGLPQDRWMRGDHEMEALVRAYIALLRTCETMHADMIQRGTDAMDIS
jgi:hypothetical protein